jgi:Fe-S oxidoreductase
MYSHPDAIVTACPLCLKTYARSAKVPVKDFAEIINDNLKQ